MITFALFLVQDFKQNTVLQCWMVLDLNCCAVSVFSFCIIMTTGDETVHLPAPLPDTGLKPAIPVIPDDTIEHLPEPGEVY